MRSRAVGNVGKWVRAAARFFRVRWHAECSACLFLFHYFYIGWCRKQEKNTPEFQKFFRQVKAQYPSAADMPESLRQDFRSKSLPLMWMTNTLTHNTRAIVMFVSCLVNEPWIYPLFEITVLAALYYYMQYRHEKMCKEMNLTAK